MPGLQRKYPLGHPRDDDTPPEPRSGLRQQSRRPPYLNQELVDKGFAKVV